MVSCAILEPEIIRRTEPVMVAPAALAVLVSATVVHGELESRLPKRRVLGPRNPNAPANDARWYAPNRRSRFATVSKSL